MLNLFYFCLVSLACGDGHTESSMWGVICPCRHVATVSIVVSEGVDTFILFNSKWRLIIPINFQVTTGSLLTCQSKNAWIDKTPECQELVSEFEWMNILCLFQITCPGCKHECMGTSLFACAGVHHTHTIPSLVSSLTVPAASPSDSTFVQEAEIYPHSLTQLGSPISKHLSGNCITICITICQLCTQDALACQQMSHNRRKSNIPHYCTVSNQPMPQDFSFKSIHTMRL